MSGRDCNSCAHHQQGHMGPLCTACVADPINFIPKWSPKVTKDQQQANVFWPDYKAQDAAVKETNPKDLVGSNKLPLSLSPKEAPAKAHTYDDGKAPLAVLPWAALDEMAAVQAYGHRKYGDFYNYRKGMEVSRNLSCAIRHIRDYMNGHDVDVGKGTPDDPGSGLNPLAHAAVRIAYVLQNLADGKAIDDRFKAQ